MDRKTTVEATTSRNDHAQANKTALEKAEEYWPQYVSTHAQAFRYLSQAGHVFELAVIIIQQYCMSLPNHYPNVSDSIYRQATLNDFFLMNVAQFSNVPRQWHFCVHHLLVNICNGMDTLHCISLHLHVIIHITLMPNLQHQDMHHHSQHNWIWSRGCPDHGGTTGMYTTFYCMFCYFDVCITHI